MSAALRVLLAVDGSDGALAVARTWAAWQGDPERPLQVRLLAVAPPPPHAFAPPALTPGQVEAALLDWGRQRLAPAQALFAATTLDWQTQVQIGATARLIIDAADPAHVDLVALGTRGVNPLRGLLVGSVALRVAQASRVPVWLASAQARTAGRRRRLGRGQPRGCLGGPHRAALRRRDARSRQRAAGAGADGALAGRRRTAGRPLEPAHRRGGTRRCLRRPRCLAAALHPQPAHRRRAR